MIEISLRSLMKPVKTKGLVTLLLLLIVPSAFSQSITVGAKLGGGVTDEFSSSTIQGTFEGFQHESRILDAKNRFMFGPTVQIHFPRRTSIELGLLYQSFGFLERSRTWQIQRDPFFPFDVAATQRLTASSLEIPTVLQYRLSEEIYRPFVGAGYVYRHLLNAQSRIEEDPLDRVRCYAAD